MANIKYDGGNIKEMSIYSQNSSLYIDVSFIFNITFDGNGGEPSSQEYSTDENGMLSTFPTVIPPEGMKFDNWYTESSGGTKVTPDTAFKEDTTLYAQYYKYYTVTLNFPENDKVYKTTRTTDKDGKITFPTYSLPLNKTFLGWYTESSGGTKVTPDTVFNKDTELYAQIEKDNTMADIYLKLDFLPGRYIYKKEDGFYDDTGRIIDSIDNYIADIEAVFRSHGAVSISWFNETTQENITTFNAINLFELGKSYIVNSSVLYESPFTGVDQDLFDFTFTEGVLSNGQQIITLSDGNVEISGYPIYPGTNRINIEYLDPDFRIPFIFMTNGSNFTVDIITPSSIGEYGTYGFYCYGIVDSRVSDRNRRNI